MNGFLVLLCCLMDDIPVGLFPTQEEAMEFGRSLDEYPSENVEETFGIDLSEAVCVKSVEFRNGVPFGFKEVKTF